MNSELKKSYALRISQANYVEMIIVSYEIINTYLSDAYDSDINSCEYDNNLDMANRCIEEMMANLHYEYEPARTLKQLYLYMKKLIKDAKYDKNTSAIQEIQKLVTRLHDSYEQVRSQDNSDTLMKNTQAVMMGMTYGRNKILDELTNECSSRGFLV